MIKYISIVLFACVVVIGCSPKTKSVTTPVTTQQPKKEVSLVGPKWQLSKINDDMKPQPPDGQILWLQLLLGGEQFSAYGGCNSGGGKYKIEKDKLTLSDMLSTQMFCEPNMKLEKSYFTKLQMTNRYEIKGNTLSLYFDKTLLLEFEAAE